MDRTFKENKVMGRYTENTEPISDILKNRYRYRRRYFLLLKSYCLPFMMYSVLVWMLYLFPLLIFASEVSLSAAPALPCTTQTYSKSNTGPMTQLGLVGTKMFDFEKCCDLRV